MLFSNVRSSSVLPTYTNAHLTHDALSISSSLCVCLTVAIWTLFLRQTRGDRNHVFYSCSCSKKVTPTSAPDLIGKLHFDSCLRSENLKAVSILPREAKALL